MSTTSPVVTGSDPSTPYPELTSPTDSVIAGDFETLSAQEQEAQREEWKAQLKRTEEEIMTLKQVLESKEAQAAGIKRRLGITHWREFSEDMTQGLKTIQESQAYKKTAEVATAAKERAEGLFSSITSSASYGNVAEKMGLAFGAAKNRMSQSLSTQDVKEPPSPVKTPAQESI